MKIGPSVKTAAQIRNLEKALLNFESLDSIQESKFQEDLENSDKTGVVKAKFVV